MKKYFLVFIIVLLVSACGPSKVATPISAPQLTAATEPPVPMATAACISFEPTDEDVDRALAYTKDIFGGAEWERSYTVQSGRVSVSWADGVDTAIAYLEALIFPCSYEEPDLNDYFNTDNWQVIFSNYESYQLLAECRTDNGLRLYQFSAVDSGLTYDINFWAQNDTDTRVISMMLVFPAESDALMDDYSSVLFPELTSCN